MDLLTCKQVCLQYEGQDAVTNASFTVQEGDYLCIIGENGSGKSTLVKAILGLKQPDSGEILYGGIKPSEIGYLPQKSGIQKDFPATVQEVVVSGCLNHAQNLFFYGREHKRHAKESMERLGIEPLAGKSFAELSGGQQQRVLLARALCAAKKLILLDEPATGLDPIAALDMYTAVETLNEQGMGVIMVSHDIKYALQYASHILHMETQAAFFGMTEDYKKTEYYRSIAF